MRFTLALALAPWSSFASTEIVYRCVSVTVGAVQATDAPDAVLNEPPVALHAYVTASPSGSVADADRATVPMLGTWLADGVIVGVAGGLLDFIHPDNAANAVRKTQTRALLIIRSFLATCDS